MPTYIDLSCLIFLFAINSPHGEKCVLLILKSKYSKYSVIVMITMGLCSFQLSSGIKLNQAIRLLMLDKFHVKTSKANPKYIIYNFAPELIVII